MSVKGASIRELNKALALQQKRDPKAQMRKASDMYEQYFLEQMLKSMRKSVQTSDFTKPNMGEKIYRENLDSEYVKSWVGRGGLGLSDLIYQQMSERMQPQMNFKRLDRFLPLEKNENFKLHKLPGSEGQENFQIEFEPKSQSKNLQAPLPAKILQHQELRPGQYASLLSFDNGMQGRMIYEGLPKSAVGAQVQRGEKLAELSPSARSLYLGFQFLV